MGSTKIRGLVKSGGEHAAYVGAMVFSAFAHFIYSVYVKRRIEPLDYGIYSTCLLLKTYLFYIQLGVMNAFNRDYPQLLGAGNTTKAKEYRNTAFTYLLSVFSLAQLLITAGFFVFGNAGYLEPKYTYGYILAGVVTLVTIIENFGANRVRIDGGFNYTSLVTALETISVGVGLVLVNYIGYYALYCTTILNMLIGIGLYFKRGYKDLKFGIDRKLLKVIMVSGIPLLINNLIWTVVNSIDKIVILSKIDTVALGVYSVAQMAFSYVVLIPNAMSQLFYIKMGKVYGATNNVSALTAISEKYTRLLAVVVSPVILCAFYFIDPLVNWIMPNYAGGTRAAQILMLGLAIYAPTMVNSNILTILKKNSALLRSSIYLCIFNIVFSFSFVLIFGARIENVALGTAISYLLRTIILVVQIKKYADVKPIRMIKASIIPVIAILAPGVILYFAIDGLYLGFIISLTVAVFVSLLLYWKKIRAIIRGE